MESRAPGGEAEGADPRDAWSLAGNSGSRGAVGEDGNTARSDLGASEASEVESEGRPGVCLVVCCVLFTITWFIFVTAVTFELEHLRTEVMRYRTCYGGLWDLVNMYRWAGCATCSRNETRLALELYNCK